MSWTIEGLLRSRMALIACVILLGGSGCSSDSLPIAAFRQDAAVTQGSESALEALSTGGDSRPPEELDAESDRGILGPDAAVMRLVEGLSANQPDALWDALPASYQRDLNDLASRFAARLHPAAAGWFSHIAAKSIELLPAGDTQASASDAAGRVLKWLASANETDLENLKHADLRPILGARGRQVMADARCIVREAFSGAEAAAALRDIAGPLPEVFQQPSLLRISVADREPARCRLEIQLPVDDAILADLYKINLEFVQIEGKWVPQWLAENWSGWIATAREWIDELLPSERPHENFGVVFRYLAQLDAMIETELARARGDQAIEPTLFDVVDFVLGFAEDLGFPVPTELWGENGEEMPGKPSGDQPDPAESVEPAR